MPERLFCSCSSIFLLFSWPSGSFNNHLLYSYFLYCPAFLRHFSLDYVHISINLHIDNLWVKYVWNAVEFASLNLCMKDIYLSVFQPNSSISKNISSENQMKAGLTACSYPHITISKQLCVWSFFYNFNEANSQQSSSLAVYTRTGNRIFSWSFHSHSIRQNSITVLCF